MHQQVPEAVVNEVRKTIQGSIERNLGESLLLSGGLDTSIIAFVSSKIRKPSAYTLVFEYASMPDLFYSSYVARKLSLKWKLIRLRKGKEIENELREVISILKTFDPMEVRNSVAISRVIREASNDSIESIMTGDGADELFAGYSFIFKIQKSKIKDALRKLWKAMSFSSLRIGEHYRTKVLTPYLDKEVAELAESLEPSFLVGKRNGTLYGKYILRIAFEDLLGKRLAWRVKRPIEYGSGTTYLQDYFAQLISEASFNLEKERIIRKDGVKIRDREHLAYYKIYRQLYPAPSETRKGKYFCPDCKGEIRKDSKFCRICGSYPVTPVFET